MLSSVTFHAEQPGPRVLILGAVHGDEVCGTIAIKRSIGEFERGERNLTHGRVTFVPICNPRAYAQKRRYTERNLNRNLLPQAQPDCYEAKLGNILCPLLRDCDVLLDLHSYHVGTQPYVFIDPATPQTIAFGAALGVGVVLSNFAGAYAATGLAGTVDPNWSIGTTEYALQAGALSVTLECGQHDAPQAPHVAYRAIIGALEYCGLLAPTTNAPAATPRHIRVDSVTYYEAGGSMARAWRDLDPIAEGELIATRADGTPLIAAHACIMVIPYPNAQPGAEWFYLGTEIA
jgi:uncharacterized protein